MRIRKEQDGFGVKYYLERKMWSNYFEDVDTVTKALIFIITQWAWLPVYLIYNILYPWKTYREDGKHVVFKTLEDAFVRKEIIITEYCIKQQAEQLEKDKKKIKAKTTYYE